MREAERIADKIVMIHKGQLLAQGTWEELKDLTGKRDLDDIFVHYVENQKSLLEAEENELQEN